MPTIQGQTIENLQQMIDILRAKPSLARQTLRAQITWDDQSWTARVVPNKVIQGTGSPLFAEEFLKVIGECYGYDAMTHGAHAGLAIRGGSVIVEGDVDLRGCVGLEAPAAFQQVRVRVDLETDATAAQIAALTKTVQRVSTPGASLGVPLAVTLSRSKEVLA